MHSHSRLESAPLPRLVCGTEELSPDGRVFACLDLQSTLRFVEVASGTVILEKKEFTWLFRQDVDPEPVYFGQLGSAIIDFSPDGHFVIVRPGEGDGKSLAFDLWKRSKIPLAGQKRLLKNTGTTAFLTPNRIIAWNGASKDDLHHGVANATVMTFPAGLPVSTAKVPYGRFLVHAADPDFVIVRPFGSYADLFFGRTTRAAAVQLRTGLVIVSNTLALDVSGAGYVGEPNRGEVGLYAIGRGLQATVRLHTK